jgi:integrase
VALSSSAAERGRPDTATAVGHFPRAARRDDRPGQRDREWAPALRAVGLEHRRIYDTRHTFAAWSIEQGVHLWHLATVMGTSVAQLEDTYARWLKRTDDQLREAFDAYDRQAANG